MTMHVNVSAWELETDDFVDRVITCLRHTGIPARQLVLELTET
ncbi:EAL domain-containing protein [Cryobacterium sp. Sr8]|nr:EAL domain-containing protein [Cryobacterium sp. Sr8]